MKADRPRDLHRQDGADRPRRGLIRSLVDRFRGRPPGGPPPVEHIRTKVTRMATSERGHRLLSGAMTTEPPRSWLDVVSCPGPVKGSHTPDRDGAFYQLTQPTATIVTAAEPEGFSGRNRQTRRLLGQRSTPRPLSDAQAVEAFKAEQVAAFKRRNRKAQRVARDRAALLTAGWLEDELPGPLRARAA